MQLVELEISNKIVVFRVPCAVLYIYIYIRMFLIMLIEFIFTRIRSFFLNVTRPFVYSSFRVVIIKGKISNSSIPFDDEMDKQILHFLEHPFMHCTYPVRVYFIKWSSVSKAFLRQRILIKGKLFPNSRISSDLVQLHVHSFISKIMLARIND